MLIHSALLLVIVYFLRDIPPPKPTPTDHKRLSLSASHFLHTTDQIPQTHLKYNDAKPIIRQPIANLAPSIQTTDSNTSFSPKSDDERALSAEEIANLPRSIQHHYGDDFLALSVAQQRYLLANLQKIRKINDIVGNRLLQSKPDEEIDTKENNIVEFYLHPDGSISGLSLSKEQNGSLLDELTLETIELAHKQYPRPKQTTLIRIRVWIVVK